MDDKQLAIISAQLQALTQISLQQIANISVLKEVAAALFSEVKGLPIEACVLHLKTEIEKRHQQLLERAETEISPILAVLLDNRPPDTLPPV